MAKEKKSNKLTVAALTQNSFIVKIGGEDVVVAKDKYENAILNMFLASRLRSTLEKHLDEYKKDEKILSPKELRDLAGAARDIAAFSAEVYEANEPISPNSEKPAEQTTDADISFDTLSTPPKVNEDEPTGETPETNGSGPVPSV